LRVVQKPRLHKNENIILQQKGLKYIDQYMFTSTPEMVIDDAAN